MAGLLDMEELAASVPEKEVAEYLREALSCYGAGAHRACVVLSNIALFDGLRAKLKALSPVNKIAKDIMTEIEPLADGQKVFETPLIHKMKAASLITELEAQTLESINNHRNKAAHPSGHRVSAEEARYVFSEVIIKFLSQPIRQTSYVVDQIQSRLGHSNFFPSNVMDDIVAIVKQETTNLDPSAKPFLFTKLAEACEDADPQVTANARAFILALATLGDVDYRNLLNKKLIDPRSSDTSYSEFISTLIASDPKLLQTLTPAAKARTKSLLIACAKSVGVAGLYRELRNPANLLARILPVLGESYVESELPEYVETVLDMNPYSPEFVSSIATHTGIFSKLVQIYGNRASSVDFGTANAFANALPAMESALCAAPDHDAFYIICCVVRAAKWGAWSPNSLVNNAFVKVPNLKTKSENFLSADPVGAALIIASKGMTETTAEFGTQYLGVS